MKSTTLITAMIICLCAFFETHGYADTIVVPVIEQNDDAEEDVTGPNAGDVRRTSTDLEIGNENGIEQWVGLRFQNITIPVGSTVNSASIKFTADDLDVGNLIIPIFGELSPNPLEFRDVTPITTRTLTPSSVSWNIDPWFPGDSGPNTTTPDLAPIVQEIVDQSGWAPGHAMAFIFQNDPMDTSERLAVSFDGNPLAAAELTIDYTPPPPGTVLAYTVIKGTFDSGGLVELLFSDNSDLSILRNPVQTSGEIEVELEAVAGTSTPSLFEITVEASGFFRTQVVQSIWLYDFSTSSFMEVDSRNASRFSDSTVIAAGSGDLSRFVEPATNRVMARIKYVSTVRRQRFRIGIDQAFWTIE